MALYAQVIHSLKFAHRRSSSAVYAASMVAQTWAVHVLQVGSTGDSREARESARNKLLLMHLSRPSFCECYERRIFECTGGPRRPRIGSFRILASPWGLCVAWEARDRAEITRNGRIKKFRILPVWRCNASPVLWGAVFSVP